MSGLEDSWDETGEEEDEREGGGVETELLIENAEEDEAGEEILAEEADGEELLGDVADEEGVLSASVIAGPLWNEASVSSTLPVLFKVTEALGSKSTFVITPSLSISPT